MGVFEINEFKKQLFEEKKINNCSTLLKDLFSKYIDEKGDKISIKTKVSYKTTLNSLNKFKPGVKLEEINTEFLESYERWYNESHPLELNASVSIYLKNLRAVINKIKYDGNLPKKYKYPFGKGQYTIKTILKPKITLSQAEIKMLVEHENFLSDEERYARDLWLMQYYCNGVNLNDLIRLRWDNLVGKCFVIRRQKTKNTTSSRPIFIRIPLIPKLKELINKIGKKNSPYVLGFLKEGLTENQIHEKKRRLAKLMNRHLKLIGKRLCLSVELLSETSRDAFATTLKRNGRSIEEIAEQLGHSTITCTRNYLGQFEENQLHEINQSLH